MNEQTVAIIGAGLIGRSWANVFARAGWQVRVWDPVPAQRASAKDQIARSLHDLARHGLVDDPDAATHRIEVVDQLADAVRDAEYVQESGPENLETKMRHLRGARCGRARVDDPRIVNFGDRRFALHRKTRRVALAAWSRIRSIRRISCRWSSCAARRGRRRTRSSARARSMTDIGQVPIEVKREIDGFILNRLQVALLTEAFRLVQEGYVTPQDLDQHDRRRSWLALGVHGAVRDDRAERAGRHRRLLRALRAVVSPLHGRPAAALASGTTSSGSKPPMPGASPRRR